VSDTAEDKSKLSGHKPCERGSPLLCFTPDLSCWSPPGSPSTPALRVYSQRFSFSANSWRALANNMETSPKHFWSVDKTQCSCVAGFHTWSLCISAGQSSMERKTFVLSSYSLIFPRLSVSTKAGRTGLMSKGCSDVQG